MYDFCTEIPLDRCAKSPGISTAEAAAKFFGDSRSHGAPKGYNSNITEVQKNRILFFMFFVL